MKTVIVTCALVLEVKLLEQLELVRSHVSNLENLLFSNYLNYSNATSGPNLRLQRMQVFPMR